MLATLSTLSLLRPLAPITRPAPSIPLHPLTVRHQPARCAVTEYWSDQEIAEAFARYDADSPIGKMDYSELRSALSALGLDFDDTGATRLLQFYSRDKDRNGLLDLEEFTRLVRELQRGHDAVAGWQRQAAALLIEVEARDHVLGRRDGRRELAHAVAARKVALGAVDEDRVRAVDVPLEVGDVLEVVDVEEDLEVGDHLEQPLLDDAHLVLAGAPDVR